MSRFVRLHLSLFDEPADDKQRTVAFLEIDVALPEGVGVDEYAEKINARCYVTERQPDDTRPTQVVIHLVPDGTAGA